MTITTDNAIVKEGFSANYTIRERRRPPGYEDSGKQLEKEKDLWDEKYADDATVFMFLLYKLFFLWNSSEDGAPCEAQSSGSKTKYLTPAVIF